MFDIQYCENENLPKFVTKYVNNEYFSATQNGFLKFGTFEEYRRSEDALESRLTDRLEGIQKSVVKRDIYGDDINLPGLKLSGSTITGGGLGNILFEQSFNAYVLCLSAGRFQKSIHDDFVSQGNTSLDCYVTYDTSKLKFAISKFFNEALRYDNFGVAGEIIYDDKLKTEEVSLSLLHKHAWNQDLEQFLKAAFHKDTCFCHEKEVRFAMWQTDKSPFEATVPVFVKQHQGIKFARYFKDAVVEADVI